MHAALSLIEDAAAWQSFICSFNPKEPQEHFSKLNKHLTLNSYLLNDSFTDLDVAVASTIKQSPSLPKLLVSKKKPTHMCRWFTHVHSLMPSDPEFDALWRKPAKVDGRLIEAIRRHDYSLAMQLASMIDVSAGEATTMALQAIHLAADHGSLELVDFLMKKGADLNARDGEGKTPIFYACLRNPQGFLEELVSRGANPLHKESQGRSLFFVASYAERTDLLPYLVSLGCDVNATTKLGRTALSKSAWGGQTKLMAALLQHSSIALNIPDSRGRTALHNAVWGCTGGRTGIKKAKNGADSPECAAMLLERGAELEAEDLEGNTPMCKAASTKAPESLKLLLDRGANIEHLNRKGKTALYQALKRGYLDCVRILVEHSADLNSGTVVTPLTGCIKYGHLDCFQYFISLPSVVVRRSHLMLCVQLEHTQMLEACIAKCDPVTTAPDLLSAAVEKGSSELVRLLLDYYPVTDELILKAVGKNKVMDVLSNSRAFSLQSRTLIDLMKSCQLTARPSPPSAVNPAFTDQSPTPTCSHDHARQHLLALLELTEPDVGMMQAAIRHRQDAAIRVLAKKLPALWEYIDPSTHDTLLHLSASFGVTVAAEELLAQAPDPQAYVLAKNAEGLDAVTIARIQSFNSFAEYLESFLEAGRLSETLKIKQFAYELEDYQFDPHPLQDLPFSYHEVVVHLPDKLEWVDTEAQLENLQTKLGEARVVGVDMEYIYLEKKAGLLSLIQVSLDDTDYVIDALVNRTKLQTVMQDLMMRTDCVKVMHGCDTDLLLLQSDLRVFSVNVFDTARAQQILTSAEFLPSLANILDILLSVKIDKKFQISDWRIRPLPRAMLEYARLDTHFLPQVYSLLRSQMSSSQLETLAGLCNRLITKSPNGRFLQITNLAIT
jgi:ankyrin repeat protein